MNENRDPYRPPAPIDDRQSWWATFCKLFQAKRDVRTSTFAEGDAVICGGIAFFVDPGDPSAAFAASPSAVDSEQRMNLIVSEAIRVLPYFLADHPELHSQLVGRRLIVRMIDSYADWQPAFRREVGLTWDILNNVLADSPDDEADLEPELLPRSMTVRGRWTSR